jgi:medium-chain acyl-[acyl-carrier-protein] hydrolase
VRLFCFPYAGGGASAFRAWPTHLGVGIEVCAVQLPGRETRIREAPFDRLSALTPVLAEGLLPHLRPPFAFFGHSMGALIAFEVARWLRANGAPQPGALLVAGHAAPHLESPRPKLHRLPDAEFISELRRYRGTPEVVLQSRELLDIFLPTLRADFALFETYRHEQGAPLSYTISAFGGRFDGEVGVYELEAWREHTSAAFRVRYFPGDHFFVHTAQAELLRAVSEELAPLGA